MKRFAPCALMLYAALSHAHDLTPPDAGHAVARYLGNEGVLISDGHTRILFDAFYSDSYGQYALVPKPIARALMNDAPPYDDVDAVFVSHVHGDHFTAAPALRYLRAHPQVRMFGSQQVADALRQAGASRAVMRRVTAFDLEAAADALSLSAGDLEISVVAVPHAGGARMADIQNLSFRVTLNDTLTVVHLGDAGPDIGAFARHQGHWKALPLAAAFPPYWLFASDDGRVIVRNFLAADRVIGVHLPAAAAGRGAQMRTESGFDFFTDAGEFRVLQRQRQADAPAP